MKYAYFGLATMIGGLIGIAFILMFQSITVNDESEYYVLKEAMEAAMIESIDITCYRDSNMPGCGEVIKISEQKFVENFTRRFAKNITGDAQSYKIEFYDIIETPPKATVIIKGKTKSFSIMINDINNDGTFNISNLLSGILEYDPEIKESTGTILLPQNKDEDLDLNVETEVIPEEEYNPDATKSDEEIYNETASNNEKIDSISSKNTISTINPNEDSEDSTEEKEFEDLNDIGDAEAITEDNKNLDDESYESDQ